SFDANGGIVRFRNCVATFRHSVRLASTSLMEVSFRKFAGFFGLFGLWHAEQFCSRTGRMDCVNSWEFPPGGVPVDAANAAQAAISGASARTDRHFMKTPMRALRERPCCRQIV